MFKYFVQLAVLAAALFIVSCEAPISAGSQNSAVVKAARGEWAPNVAYATGDTVTYQGVTYTCRQAHTSLVGWEPPAVAALWLVGGSTTQPPSPTPTPTPTTTTAPTPTPTPVSGQPDLIVTNVTWSPAAVSAGTAVSFTVTIKNQGGAATPSGTKIGIAYLVDGVKVAWTGGYFPNPGLGAGQSITLNSDGGPSGVSTWSATSGTHTVSALVDDVSIIAESNENNNTSAGKSLTVGGTVTPPPSGFKIVGYMPSWQGDVNSIQYTKLTHINYAFALPNSDGSIQAIPGAGTLSNLVSLAHAKGVKVLLSFGGWNNGDTSAFQAIGADANRTSIFATNVLNVLNQYSLDGADIDWEWPDTNATMQGYQNLISALRSKLGSKLVTSAVGVSNDYISGTALNTLDFVNIMAYDGGWPNNGAANSPMSLAQQGVNYWVSQRGLAKSKAVLGVPFYGRSDGWSDTKAYKDIVASNPSAANVDDFGGFHYNGIPTIQSKTKYAKTNAGGIMMWELSQDASGSSSLLSAIYSAAQ